MCVVSVQLGTLDDLRHKRLEFCLSVWSPHYQKDKELMERVQHRFTRMIEGFSLMLRDS